MVGGHTHRWSETSAMAEINPTGLVQPLRLTSLNTCDAMDPLNV